MNNIDKMKSAIVDLDVRIKAWKWTPENPFPKLQDDIFSVLEHLFDFYLVTTPGERQEIRELVAKREAVRFQLFGFMYKAAQMLTSTGDSRWLYLGLTAASIEDLNEDARETYGRLGDLFLAAAQVGIEARPYFKDVALKSNTEVKGLSHESMRELLETFDQSPYFDRELRGKLNSS